MRANVPAAVSSTLVSNPLTFAPIYYLAYRTGLLVTGAEVHYPERQLARITARAPMPTRRVPAGCGAWSSACGRWASR